MEYQFPFEQAYFKYNAYVSFRAGNSFQASSFPNFQSLTPPFGATKKNRQKTNRSTATAITAGNPSPIASMYGIFAYIYQKNQPTVGKYTSPMDGMGNNYQPNPTTNDSFDLAKL